MIRVLHGVPVWLTQTMTWLYNHLVRMSAPDIEHHACCRDTRHLDQFPFDRLIPPVSGGVADSPSLAGRFLRQRPIAGLSTNCRLVSPRIFHSHFGDEGWENSLLLRTLRIPHAVSFYGYDATMLPRDARWRFKFRILFHAADRFFCEGPHMAGTLRKLGCPWNKIRIQRLGVDLQRFPYRARKFGPDLPLRILLTGSFKEKKGFTYGLEAVVRAASTHPDLRVDIVGDCSPGQPADLANRRRMEEIVSGAGLGDRVRFHGYLPYDELSRLADESNVFLSPSVIARDGNSEGGAPVVLVEMAAAGLFPLATAHCDVPFVLSPAARSCLAAERDAAGLAEVLKRLIDGRLNGEMICQANREYIERFLSLEKTTGDLAGHYRDLLGDHLQTVKESGNE